MSDQHKPFDPSAIAQAIYDRGPDSAAAEAALYEQYLPALQLFLERRAPDLALAEDVAQESLIIVLTRLRDGKVADTNRLAAFTHGVAKHVLKATLRKRGVVLGGTTDPTDFDRDGSSPTAPGPNTETLHESRTRVFVRKIIAKVTNDRYREILQRIYIADQSKQEVMSAMMLTDHDFRQVASRARTAFQQIIARDHPEMLPWSWPTHE